MNTALRTNKPRSDLKLLETKEFWEEVLEDLNSLTEKCSD
jgi:hypothetical protein